MARLRYNLVETALDADITDSDLSIGLAGPLQEGGVDIPTVSSPDILAIRIGAEILWITAYTSGSSSATVTRGEEDTPADEHFAGDAIKHVITKEDFAEVGGSATSIVIAGSNAPAAALSSADYVCDGTNDEVQLQAAHDELDAEGGVIEIIGTLECQGDVMITNWNVVIRGAGPSEGWGPNAAILRTGGSDTLFNIQGTVYFSDLYLADEDSAGRSTALILSNFGASLFIHNCWMTFAQAGNLILCDDGGGILHIWRSTIYMDNGSSGDAISAPDGSQNITVSDTEFRATNGYLIDYDDTGGSFSPDRFITIRDCWGSTSSSSPSAGLCRIIGASSGPLRVHIEGNRVPTTSAIAIDLTDVTPTVSDNVIGRNGNPTSSLGTTAIKLTSCDVGGLIANNTILHAGHHGIWLLDSSDIEVIGNVIRSYGRTTTTTYSGILVDGNSDRNTVVENELRKAGSGNVPLYGIRVDDSTCNDNLVRYNDLFNSSASNGNEFSDAGTDTRGWEERELAYVAGNIAVAAGVKRNRFAQPAVLGLTLLNINTAPVTTAVLVDVHKDGTTIYTTQASRPTIAAAGVAGQSVALPDVKYIAAASYLTADVDQIGTGTVGADLVVLQRYMPI